MSKEDYADELIKKIQDLHEFHELKRKYTKSKRLSKQALKSFVEGSQNKEEVLSEIIKLKDLFERFGSNKEAGFLQLVNKYHTEYTFGKSLKKIKVDNKQAFFELINLMRKGVPKDLINSEGSSRGLEYVRPNLPIITGTLKEIAEALQQAFDLNMSIETIKKTINDPSRTSRK